MSVLLKFKWSMGVLTLSSLLSFSNNPVFAFAPADQELAAKTSMIKTTSVQNNIAINDIGTSSIELLQQGFMEPSADHKPITWYHVMNSNMSKAGVTKDLTAMAEAGIGGIILFNIGLDIPKGKVLFNSAQHIDMIGHIAAESKRLGLSFGLHNCDGWSSSAGPWVTPEHSMKQVTWNETIVQSNSANNNHVNVQLAQPMTMLDYYHDIAVLAYPSLETEITDASLAPMISASDADFDISVVSK